MGLESNAEKAKIIIRSRLTDQSFIFSFLSQSSDSNHSKLKHLMLSSVTEACNNSVLLLGPRGCGKKAVLELVLVEVLKEYPDMISVIKLNGLLHSDNNCALKEITRQLCLQHQLQFSKMASFDENSQFLLAILRECGLAHKSIVFVLDEFDLFTQGKQTLLYHLLDAMQAIKSQAILVGVSCRLDADQILEKRVSSRFSHRKLVFLPPSPEDYQRLIEHILILPSDSKLPNDYSIAFNREIRNILKDEEFKGIITTLCYSDATVSTLSRFLFSAICRMGSSSGFLSVENFKSALSSILRQPKVMALKDCSIVELYILVCVKRLEVKEVELCNFNAIMKEYKSIHDTFQTSDSYSRDVCLRAFEHLLERALISLEENRGHGQSLEFRPVKLLITRHQLVEGLKTHQSCPGVLHRVLDRQG